MDKYPQKEKIRVTVKVSGTKIIAIAIVFGLWIGSLVLVWLFASGNIGKDSPLAAARLYPYINPRLRNMTQEERGSKAFSTLIPLRDKLMKYLGNNDKYVAYYIEDLNTGAWSGYREKENFIPASLLKIPIAIGTMKKIDKDEWNMDTKLKIEPKYKDKNFGELWKKEDNAETTVDELIRYMLQESDNTATNILFGNISAEERDNVYYHIGITNPEAEGEQTPNHLLFTDLTPRNLATFFRSLYNATYLTRKSSNYLLDTLTQTKFDENTAYSVPNDVKVAHKMAAFYDKSLAAEKNYHDCGITFLPDHPYLYCYLTKDLEPQDAQKLIYDMGEIVFKHFLDEGK